MDHGATPPSSVATVAMGSRVAGYRLEEQIGRGGMAVVFRALDERLNRQVALKILRSARIDDAFRHRFVRESQAAAAVDDPHIIPVYEAGEADGVLFIAMRLVRGGDLRTLVAHNGPLSPARTGWIVSCVASALDAAHASGLVHRDVKPANMLLEVRAGRPDHVYLSDFGVSKAAIETGGVTDSGQFLGTVDYAAPEQIQGRGVDGRTDQYALGCSAYELLCGHPPFSGKELLAAMYAQVSQPPPAPSSVRGGLLPAVDAVFARVLAKSPADRYGTCEEFASELRSALGLGSYAAERPADRDPASAADSEDVSTLAPAAARVQAGQIRAAARGSWPESGSTIQMPAGAPGAQTPGSPRRHLSSADGVRWRRALAGVLAVAVVGGGAAAFALTHGRAPAVAVPVRFSQAYDHGRLAVTQVWRLSGSRGTRLDVTIKARNVSARAVHAQLYEPIPGAVAKSLSSVSFDPSPHVPNARSRVVVWDFSLRPGGSRTVVYRVPEPPKGATAARLGAWVRAFRKVARLQDLEPTKGGGLPVLTYMMIIPSEVSLEPGQSYGLTLGGVLSDAGSAPARDLTGATWKSANQSVVTVTRSGVIVGVAPGTTVVTAQAGSVTASAIVTVLVPSSGQPAPGSGSAPGQSSPATTPSSTGSPTGTPTGTPSPTGSPTGTPTGTPSPTGSPTGTPTSTPSAATGSAGG